MGWIKIKLISPPIFEMPPPDNIVKQLELLKDEKIYYENLVITNNDKIALLEKQKPTLDLELLKTIPYTIYKSLRNSNVNENDGLNWDLNKLMKYYECDTLYSIFSSFNENTEGWFTNEISDISKSILLNSNNYTYTNSFDNNVDNFI